MRKVAHGAYIPLMAFPVTDVYLPVYVMEAEKGSAPIEPETRGGHRASVLLMVTLGLESSKPGSPPLFTARAMHCTWLPAKGKINLSANTLSMV